MGRYVLKRIFASIITLWVVVTLTFTLSRVIPGGPFDSEKDTPIEVRKNLEERYKLNEPVYIQYVDYLKNLVKLDLGPSFKQKGVSINEIISRGFPVSAKLGVAAVSLAVVFGLILGIIAALKQGRWPDRVTMFISTLGVTIPAFVIATLFIYFFAEKLRWFPVYGLDTPRHYVLPAIALGGYSMAFISRLVRSSLLDVIRQDYIRTAKAKGLSETSIIIKHALKKCYASGCNLSGTTCSRCFDRKLCYRKDFYNTRSW